TNVGKDPHLFHLSNSNELFVACQSGQLYMLNGDNLIEISNIPLTGAHGIFPAPDQNNIFLTNLPGGQLYSVNTSNNTQNGSAINSQGSTPHNIVLNESGNKMFVTHSGMTVNTLSTYSLSSGLITPETTVTIGTNPFGLAYYKREVK
ncbi:MAG: YncE family protein, partial [Bacteroidota bacterium]|nr:YncE family protein [Bacteroidota bacterium]